MRTYLDCIPCFLRQSLDAARRVTEDPDIHEQILRGVLQLTTELNLNMPPPWVGQAIHRRLRELTGVDDPFRGAKSRFNQLAMEMLPELRAEVKQAPDPMVAATKLAIAANIIDLGAKSSVTEEQAVAALRAACHDCVYGDWTAFHEAVADAKTILYLADNAGEIVIDRLLIEELGPERVTLVVRGRPVINDATISDAREVGLHELVDVIDNGSDAPGTILEDCSADFQERFLSSDLIIAKGQGNFETLSDTTGNIFFLFNFFGFGFGTCLMHQLCPAW